MARRPRLSAASTRRAKAGRNITRLYVRTSLQRLWPGSKRNSNICGLAAWLRLTRFVEEVGRLSRKVEVELATIEPADIAAAALVETNQSGNMVRVRSQSLQDSALNPD